MMSMDATNGQSNGKFKLQINSNLIHSDSSTLPDELKSLGVCAYDEQSFERGILDQMNNQINEYENDSDSDESIIEETNNKISIKRKLATSTETSKRTKLGTEGPNRLSNEFDEELDGISWSPLVDDEENESNDIEQLIKNGEMTPFGTVVNFEQNSIKQNNSEQSSSSKTLVKHKSDSKLMTREFKKPSLQKARPPNVHKLDQINDFDSFLSDLDSKKKVVKPKKIVSY